MSDLRVEKFKDYARRGYFSAISDLVDQGLDPNARDEHGATLLLWATMNGCEDAAIRLLEKGADPNLAGTDKNLLPLIEAARSRQRECVNLLLKKSAHPNARDGNGCTALTTAINDTPETTVVRALLENGADINLSNKDGKLPIVLALDRSQRESIIMLIERGASVDVRGTYGDTLLQWAMKKKDTEILGLLIDKNVYISGSTCKVPRAFFMDAELPAYLILNGQAGLLERLLKQKYDINSAKIDLGQTLLTLAVVARSIDETIPRRVSQEMCRLLLVHGADSGAFDSNGDTPLFAAMRSRKEDLVATLLQNGADANKLNRLSVHPLHYALKNNLSDTVGHLLAHGADPNARDRFSHCTALMVAAEHHRTLEIKNLLAHGADPSLQDSFNDTAKDYARRRDYTDIVDVLGGPFEVTGPQLVQKKEQVPQSVTITTVFNFATQELQRTVSIPRMPKLTGQPEAFSQQYKLDILAAYEKLLQHTTQPPPKPTLT